MLYEKGRIVRSLAGRDKYCYLAVVSAEDGCLLVCDGKERPLERPKRKNVKHIALTGGILSDAQTSTNRALRRALRQFAEESTDKEGA